MDYSEEMKRDFANDALTHQDIADKHGKSWDWVQRNRSKWRKANGLGPVPSGPRPQEQAKSAYTNPDELGQQILSKLDTIIQMLQER